MPRKVAFLAPLEPSTSFPPQPQIAEDPYNQLLTCEEQQPLEANSLLLSSHLEPNESSMHAPSFSRPIARYCAISMHRANARVIQVTN